MLKPIYNGPNRPNNKSAGFTLIELLVVISIVGFLTVASVV
ncbi:type II secretion system protein, partial [Candidatus Falkowbacteria bacterium]|nr:type II secretion system protein [Candidatus Falkowbacteria bacterium]